MGLQRTQKKNMATYTLYGNLFIMKSNVWVRTIRLALVKLPLSTSWSPFNNMATSKLHIQKCVEINMALLLQVKSSDVVGRPHMEVHEEGTL